MSNMGVAGWIAAHWLSLVQTGAVTVALLFGGLAFAMDARTRKADNLIRLSERHLKLWERLYTNPQLSRILDPGADVARQPVSREEELFMIFVFLHLSDTYHIIQAGLFPKSDGLREDVHRFFSLPIPRAVWRKLRDLQDKPFARFVEQCWPEPGTGEHRRHAASAAPPPPGSPARHTRG